MAGWQSKTAIGTTAGLIYLSIEFNRRLNVIFNMSHGVSYVFEEVN